MLAASNLTQYIPNCQIKNEKEQLSYENISKNYRFNRRNSLVGTV
jgi:hypothetical protein